MIYINYICTYRVTAVIVFNSIAFLGNALVMYYNWGGSHMGYVSAPTSWRFFLH